MSNLLSELDAVVGQLRSYDDKTVAGVRLSTLSESAVRLIRTHHAEIAADAKDAARYRHIRLRLWPAEVEDTLAMYPHNSELDLDRCGEHASKIDAAIDAAMSAREGE